MLPWDHHVKTSLQEYLERELGFLDSYIEDQRRSNLKIPLLAAELFAEEMFSFLRDVLACSVEILLKRDSCKGSKRERRVIEKCFATLASQLTRTSGSLVPSPSSAAEPSPAEHPSFDGQDTWKSSLPSQGPSIFTRATTVNSSHNSSTSACQSSLSIVSANKKPEEFKSFRYSSMNTPSDELTSTSVRYEETKPPPENSKLGCQRGGNRLRKIRRQYD
ncbi:hypothetical protein QFC19_001773 [Naganishia cerealis]|uniref:Uncharacterized protein n=1 Tax=Naganishia cerealis TaxID=610337 RepID=A0ACC2WHS0_9TREE|nr:hypothetical protein QFC19_001773 [Naganishia cerealis]